MKKYKIQIIRKYKNYLDDLKKSNLSLQNQLCDKIKEIQKNPYKSKFKTIKNTDGCRRARSGDYGIIYFVERETIFITKIDLRKNIYKSNSNVKNFNNNIT